VLRILISLVALLWIPSSLAEVRVFACEPEWAALTQEIGGDRVSVYAATTALQDTHHIQARPSLIAKLRRADLLICTGSELEIGWLPILLRKANNSRVLPGTDGYFEATSVVNMLGKPDRLDRAGGDIHAGGNPHIHTDPRNLLPVAQTLAQRLETLDPDHGANYQQNLHRFQRDFSTAIAVWEKQAERLRGLPIVVHHESWPYLVNWLGLEQIATLEPKPGIPPGSRDLANLLRKLEQRPARAVVHAAFEEPRAAQWLSRHAELVVVELPFTVGGNAAAHNLMGLYSSTIEKLLEAIQ
jgi:zinc/manganese transport system substrate-binding protein